MRSKLLGFLKYGSAVGAAAVASVTLQSSTDNTVCSLKNRFSLSAKNIPRTDDSLNMGHGTKWDYNWDWREPSCLVKPLKKDADQEKAEEYSQALAKAKPKASRYLVLVRHGQYNMEGREDSDRYLTEIGRKQAGLAGERLKALLETSKAMAKDENGNETELKVRLFKSTMTRANETGDIILTHLPGVQVSSCDLIREGAPCVPEPPSEQWTPEPFEFHAEGARIEAGFRKYFHRADSSQNGKSVDILVCHGNVIRYCVCRALQIDPAAWLRMSLHNGSITVLVITPSGRVKVVQIGDAGHLPPDLLTFN